jgi:hypothetical protein
MPAIGAALRFAEAAFRLVAAGLALVGLPFTAGLAAGFFFAGIGIVMPGMFIPCID